MDERISNNLKMYVNEMLFTHLPDQTTIAELELLAVKIHSLIVKQWESSGPTVPSR